MGTAVGKDPLRHHRDNTHLQSTFGNDTFGSIAERVAKFMGTPKFIIIQTVIVLCWITLNTLLLTHHPFDPYPFILLNLAFSTQSAYAAPMILLAQTRAAARDKAATESDAAHRQELADSQAAQLKVNTDLTEKIHSMQTEQMQILALLEGNSDGRPGSDPGLDSQSGTS
jgi:uncharacterized membrane protein